MENHLTRRIDANRIQALLNSTQSSDPEAVGIQFLVMTVLSLLTIITFNILRPNNQALYEPKIKYHANGKCPPHVSDTCCGWITPLSHTHEERLNEQVGLDAVTFLRFLRLMKWLFTLTALCACGLLIPLDFLYTLSLKPMSYDILTAMTIQDVQGVRLYAHIGVVYFITIILIILVLFHWRVIHNFRSQWFRSSEYQRLFHARTLYVTDIPRRRRSTTGLYGIFKGMNLPYPVTSVHIGKDVGELPELIDNHNELVEEFEEVLVQCMQDTHSQDERPFITTGGCCGMGGRRQDAITYYTEKLRHTAAIVQQYRAQIEMREPEIFGFATIASIPLAHAAARELKGMHPKGLTFELAPNPSDIIWKNMGLSKGERIFRKITGFFLLYSFCFLSLIPLFPIASLANLDAIAASGYIPFLQTWLQHSPITYTLVSGLLPPAIAGIFGSFIPILMRWLSKYMGARTHTSLDRIVIARYFGFLVISQLVFFTVIGVIFQSILEIIIAIQSEGSSLKLVLSNLDKLPARLARTYVDQSSFWLKWFALRGFLVILDLAQLVDFTYMTCRTRLTPREIRERSKPPMFSYDVHYSNLLFIGLIGLLFAPVAPLVSLAAAILFWLCSWIYKYQLMFKYITRVETGGRAWNVVINRLLFSCIFMQIVMVITIGFQAQFKSLKFLATLPPILLTLLFKHYINRHFANDFEYYIPRHTELSRSVVHSKDIDIPENKLQQRYENPALSTNIFSPMVHPGTMLFLRGIYEGKSSHTSTRGISATEKAISDINTKAVLEGVEVTPVNETKLEYDPTTYKHDREADCDFDSVNATSPNFHPHRSTPQMLQNPISDGHTMRWELGHEHHFPDVPNNEAVGAAWKASDQPRDQQHSLSSLVPLHELSNHTTKFGHSPSRFYGSTEQPISLLESVTRPRTSCQPLQHGLQNDGYNPTPNMSREQTVRAQFNPTIITAGSGRHTQATDRPMLRTHRRSRERPGQHKLPHQETDTPPHQHQSTS